MSGLSFLLRPFKDSLLACWILHLPAGSSKSPQDKVQLVQFIRWKEQQLGCMMIWSIQVGTLQKQKRCFSSGRVISVAASPQNNVHTSKINYVAQFYWSPISVNNKLCIRGLRYKWGLYWSTRSAAASVRVTPCTNRTSVTSSASLQTFFKCQYLLLY